MRERKLGSRNDSVDPKGADRQGNVNAYSTSTGLFTLHVLEYLI